MTSPVSCVWTGRAFEPISARFLKLADEQHGVGEVVNLAPVEDRSAASHRQFFASINEAWQNLPEHLAARYPTAESLRHAALNRAGYCDVETFVASSKAEALRLAAFLRSGVRDGVEVVVNGSAITRLTPHSQSMRAMGKATFEASKEAVLNAIAGLIGVTTQDLHQAANDTEQGRAVA